METDAEDMETGAKSSAARWNGRGPCSPTLGSAVHHGPSKDSTMSSPPVDVALEVLVVVGRNKDEIDLWVGSKASPAPWSSVPSRLSVSARCVVSVILLWSDQQEPVGGRAISADIQIW